MKPSWTILSELCTKINAKRIAEIGVSRGINANMFLTVHPSKLDRYYLIDPDTDGVFDYTWFRDRLEVRFLRLTSMEASMLIDTLDLVYIDANHNYEHVYNDIKFWLPKIRKGGIICGHDYGPGDPGVVQAVHEFFGQSVNIEKIEENLSTWWYLV